MAGQESTGGLDRFVIEGLVGVSLLGQKKHAEARPLLFAAYAGIEARESSVSPSAKPSIARIVRSIAQLYHETARAVMTRISRGSGPIPSFRQPGSMWSFPRSRWRRIDPMMLGIGHSANGGGIRPTTNARQPRSPARPIGQPGPQESTKIYATGTRIPQTIEMSISQVLLELAGFSSVGARGIAIGFARRTKGFVAALLKPLRVPRLGRTLSG